ncbi:TPA: hypothetical protein NGW16_004176 [Vibrio parahaemolyticus]|nr:hypothetical protein [Vibrio parahaemolyticus]
MFSYLSFIRSGIFFGFAAAIGIAINISFVLGFRNGVYGDFEACAYAVLLAYAFSIIFKIVSVVDRDFVSCTAFIIGVIGFCPIFFR